MFSSIFGGGAKPAAPHSTTVSPVRESNHTNAHNGEYNSSAVMTQPPAVEESEPVSSFSFISGAQSSAPEDSEQTFGSGFSFMRGEDDVAAVAPQSRPSIVETDFMNTVEVTTAVPQDLMLNKVAAASKGVKKKKKVARVGLGRDEDHDEPQDSAGHHKVSTPEKPQSHQVEAHSAEDYEPIESHGIPAVPVVEPVQVIEQHPVEPPLPPPPAAPAALEPSLTAEDLMANLGGGLTHHHSMPSQSSTSVAVDKGIFDVPLAPSVVSPVPAVPVVEELSKPEEVETVPEESVEDDTDNDEVVPQRLFAAVLSMDETICRGLQAIRHSYESALTQHQQTLREIESAHRTIGSLKEKIVFLEAKQTNLARQEDFEAAELISVDIESAQHSLVETIAHKAEMIASLRSMRIAYEANKVSLIAQFEEGFQGLSQVCEETERNVHIANTRLHEYADEEKSRMAVEQQRVDLERAHCDREQETLDSESAVIEEAIQSQVGEFYSRKESCEVSLYGVQEDIRRLEEQLRIRREEEQELLKTLKYVDGRIVEVRKKYDRQLQRIAGRKETLVRRQMECSAEQEEVVRGQKEMETTLAQSAERIAVAQSLVLAKQCEARVSSLVVADISASPQTASDSSESPSLSLSGCWYGIVSDALLTELAHDHATQTSESQRLAIAVEEREAALGHAKADVDALHIEQELLEMKQKTQIDAIERSEIAKKTHAANKRFKEAANAAKDLKEAQESKEQIDAQLLQLQSSIADEVQRIVAVENELQSVKLALKASQREEKVEQLHVLLSRAAKCQFLIKRLRKDWAALSSHENVYPQREGLVLKAIDLYVFEDSQLQSLIVSLAADCGIEDLPAYAAPFALPEPVEEVVTAATAEVTVSEEVVTADADADANELIEESVTQVDCGIDSELTTDIDMLKTTEDAADLVTESSSGFAFLSAADDNSALEGDADVVTDVVGAEPTVPLDGEEEAAEVEAESAPTISVEELQRQIAELEEQLDVAAGDEDFDRAAELQEQIEALQAQIPVA